MREKEVCIGLCFFADHLLYAVGSATQNAHLNHIGAIDFNFDLSHALIAKKTDRLYGIRDTVINLKEQFGSNHLRILLNPVMECWACMPKLVYDDAEEREDRINILMNGIDRKHIHSTWHALSNKKYRLLQLQTQQIHSSIARITGGSSGVSLLSAFEIGERWIKHARPGGAFLTVCCFKNCISISSFILGQLRGATYIQFEYAEDLPYLWLQHARGQSWMQGLHEQIHIYGWKANKIDEILQPFWDDAGTVTKMDTLKKMQATAAEKTYAFELNQAYPAIMMALN